MASHDGRSRFPGEKRSRRPGWSEGPSLILADGKAWHLPAIDEGLIPYLARLVPTAESLAEYFVMVGEAARQGDKAGVAVVGPMAEVYLSMFLGDLLAIQYRNRRKTLLELIRLGGADFDAAWPVVDAYRGDFARFVIKRFPIGFKAAELVVTLN